MTRLACLWIPHFAAAVEIRDRGRAGIGDGAPLIVYQGEHVLEPCAQAAAAGVIPGLRLRAALARCPEAEPVAAEPPRYRAVWEGILDALGLFTPAVEDHAPGLAYLEAAGMGALYGGEEAWCRALIAAVAESSALTAKVGLAAGRFAARMAAGRAPDAPGFELVEKADRDYLAPLPVTVLPLSAEAQRRLRLLGIADLGRFARLPADAAVEQFGPEAAAALRLARGEDPCGLRGWARRSAEIHWRPDDPVADRELLIAALAARGRTAVEAMSRRQLAARRALLRLETERGRVRESSAWVGALLGPEGLRDLLERLLRTAGELHERVAEARLTLIGLEPTARGQLNLFDSGEEQRQAEVLASLIRRYGQGRVLRPHPAVPAAPLAAQRYALAPWPEGASAREAAP